MSASCSSISFFAQWSISRTEQPGRREYSSIAQMATVFCPVSHARSRGFQSSGFVSYISFSYLHPFDAKLTTFSSSFIDFSSPKACATATTGAVRSATSMVSGGGFGLPIVGCFTSYTSLSASSRTPAHSARHLFR